MSASNTGRRGLFGGAAAVLLLAAPAAASTPAKASGDDAELLKLCAEFDGYQRELDRFNATPTAEITDHDAFEAEVEEVNADWWDVLREITDVRPRTREGLKAKAGVGRKAWPMVSGDDTNSMEDMVLSVLDDIIAGGAVT